MFSATKIKLKYALLIIFLLIKLENLNAQELNKLDTNINENKVAVIAKGNNFFPYNKNRISQATLVQVAGFTSNFATLYKFWYADYPKSNFHFFNDNDEYMQVDKASHFYASYLGGALCMQMWKWAGASKNKYVWLGGTSGLMYETLIEVMDGFSEHWGFSWGDYTANILGTSLVIGQELAWNDQRIKVKFSTHYETYQPIELERFAQKIDGTKITDRLFKNYNPQTYWLSFNINSFFPKSKLPNWLSVAVGYGAENIIGAKHTDYIFADGSNINVDDLYPQYRQWYLAPDIDLTKIKTKSKFLKTALFVLNSFKFPTPSLEYSQGSFKFNWLHF